MPGGFAGRWHPMNASYGICFSENIRWKFTNRGLLVDLLWIFIAHLPRLVIVVDGSQHYEKQGLVYDTERSEFLMVHGLEVLRFSNRDIDRSFDGVCTQIDIAIRNRQQDPLSHLRWQLSQRESQGSAPRNIVYWYKKGAYPFRYAPFTILWMPME